MKKGGKGQEVGKKERCKRKGTIGSKEEKRREGIKTGCVFLL